MNIKESLKKIVFFDIRQDLSDLTSDEKEALSHCIKAAEIITDLYLTQIYPESLALREKLKHLPGEDGKDLSRYFEVNGGPWDSFDEKKPFISGVGSKPKEVSFYPADITEKEWENMLASNPDSRSSFESNYSVIRRVNGKLTAVPYNEAYKDFLDKAARELNAAAKLLPEGKLKNFLELRAEGFLSNNYWDSDIAWIDTDGNPFEVTVGPCESYEDGLFGIKATYEAIIALPDKESTQELQKFSAAVPEFDVILSERLGHKPKGAAIPLEVVRDVYRGGEAAFGRLLVAYNLPNDRNIHEIKGSKKVFSRTMMEAKFSKIGQGIAERVLKTEDLKHYQFRNRLLFVLGHELAHGLGPGVRNIDGREVSFEVLLKDLHSMLEEAKADMLGTALLEFFYKKGLIKKEELVGCIITEVVAFVQGWRMSYAEAHSASSLIEYNWLKSNGAVRYDEERKVFDIDPEKTLKSMISLSEEFIKIQMEGDYGKAADFIKKWCIISPEIPGIVARLKDLPVEVHPVFQV